MNNVKILDCTLRDGGRIIDCKFPDQQTKRVVHYLQQAGIDIIEVGFLRDWRKVNYKGNSTFFTSTKQIAPFLPQKRDAVYTAFIDFGMFDFDSLDEYDGTSIDAIRFGFTKKDYDNCYGEVVSCAKKIKEKGYKLFLQGVNSLNYTDLELLKLIEFVNTLEPFGFGIVDTYGAMYIDDVRRIYSLIDHNLDPKIAIDFHSHNNYQLSFSFAQEIITMSSGVRNVIIDGTLRGMGKGAGNANTELLADYLVRKKGYLYDIEKILEIIDLDIHDIYDKVPWGYSPASFMGGVYRSHPNNIIYLLNKYAFTTNDIKNILSMLSDTQRQRYPYDIIDKLCFEYTYKEYDDALGIAKIAKLIEGKNILVLAPGQTLSTQKEKIENYIAENSPKVISVNFLCEMFDAISFFGNKKRYYSFCYDNLKTVIVTSDIASGTENEIVISAKNNCISEDGARLSSISVIIKALCEAGAKNIAIAGMDGFSDDPDANYFDSTMAVERTSEEVRILNARRQSELDYLIRQYWSKSRIFTITSSRLKINQD